jgi:hypothetical protein
MSWIGNNQLNVPFGTPFTTSQGGMPGQQPASLPALMQSDALGASPSYGGASLGSLGGGFEPDSAGSLSGIMSGFSNLVNTLFGQVASLFGSNAGSTQTPGAGTQWSPSQVPASNERMFQSASMSSWGDPHDSFDGTTSDGQNVGQSWDNMRSHADLLDSNSFSGGYQVSTQVTAPNQNGVTMNQSASVTTGNGSGVVTMNANGQYQITSNGQSVALQSGQTAQLGGGASVTLNSDGSLTVADQNGQGGSISTTLRSNGQGGVDVKAQASGVDLGGYLVNHSDGAGHGPQRPNPWPSPWPGPHQLQPYPQQYQSQPYEPYQAQPPQQLQQPPMWMQPSPQQQQQQPPSANGIGWPEVDQILD